MTEELVELANCLREYRIKAGYTREALALKLGLKDEQAVANWEEMSCAPSYESIGRMVELLALPEKHISSLILNFKTQLRKPPHPKALIVSTETETQKLLQKKLNDHFSVKVQTASSVREALELLDKEQFNLVVCNYMLRDGVGSQVFDGLEKQLMIEAHFIMYDNTRRGMHHLYRQEHFIVIPRSRISELIEAIKFLSILR